jgi:hypothetical protein
MTKCELATNVEYDLVYVHNKSVYPISWYTSEGVKGYDIYYPDTILPEAGYRVFPTIQPNEIRPILGRGYKIKEFFTILPNDTMSVFIFHADTLEKYSWEVIRDEYKILKRYDLSLRDLKNMNYTITYQ